MQKLQLTLAIIKPHALKNPVALSYIRHVIKNKFIVVKSKRIFLDKETAGKFYQEHIGKFFYNRLVTFMSSGSIDLHIMGHVNAIQMWRKMLGPTSVYKAQFQDPYCLRGMFGISDTRNVAHGSGDLMCTMDGVRVATCHIGLCNDYSFKGTCVTNSPESAEREIKFFFPDFSFYIWHNEAESRYRNGPIIFNNFLFEHVRKL